MGIKESIRKHVQVAVPFQALRGPFLPRVLEEGINPEIHFDSNTLDSLDLGQAETLAGLLEQRGIVATLHAPFLDMAPGSPDKMVREAVKSRLEQVLKIAAIFRPRSVVCHAAYEGRKYHYIKEQWLGHSISLWKWFSSELGELGCLLALENVFETSPEELIELFDALSAHGVGFCLDVGHQSAFSSTVLDRWLSILGRFLRQLHLHDNMGESDEHLPIGRGMIDFTMLFSWLGANMARPPIITLEPHMREGLEECFRELGRLWPW